MLILKYRFKPWELDALTLPETFSLYLQAINDEAEHSKEESHDDRLAPHKADEARIANEKFQSLRQAFGSLTPEQKIEYGYRMGY